jgi:2-polyprenyl-6-methoxyphenol hydroxylase-like FAD-dependent oxidoreductase
MYAFYSGQRYANDPEAGAAEPIEAAGGIRNDVEIYTGWGRIVAPREQMIKRPAYGYSIRRETLDPLQRKIAVETPGVNYMPGFSGHELLMSKNRIAGVAIHGAGSETGQIKAALVVGADGRQSRIAELAV